MIVRGGEALCSGDDRSSVHIREQATRLRLKLAINLFKRYLLGSKHVAGCPQLDEMLKSPGASRLFELIDFRTWESWFYASSPIPKRKTIRALDQIAHESIRVTYTCNDLDYVLAPRFFEELVHGGLVSAMAKTAKSKRAKAALCAAVEQYAPLSAWHLHLDAVEVSGLAEDLGGMPWTYVKQVAAKRLMSVLYVLWAPRSGAIYRLFASGLRLRWNAATEDEKVLLREKYSLVPGAYFESRLKAVPVPKWSSIGVSGDLVAEHIHKALLAMAADPSFLVGERKHAWAFDLASSALAMHALAWSDRYKTFGFSLREEQICWRFLSEMFFTLNNKRQFDHRALNAAVSQLGLSWSRTLRRTLTEGRSSYGHEIAALGVDVPSILAVAQHATEVHPLIYQGG